MAGTEADRRLVKANPQKGTNQGTQGLGAPSLKDRNELLPTVVMEAFGAAPHPTHTSIFRHGDRTPTESYPKDPYRNGSHWKQGWGALTKLGMVQMHSFGMALRKRYGTFLGDRYSPDDAYMVSSDHDRCLMSAQLCLAGLYPPVGDQIWNSRIPWQPIPVHTTPKHLDQLIVMRKPCPAYNRELNWTYNSPFVTKVNSENADLYRYLSEKSGAKVESILALESLYNTLEIEERNNLELPEWTASVYPDKMKDIAALSLALFTFTEQQKRLKGGPLIKDVVEHMLQKAAGTLNPERKIFLYSGHDLNLVSSLRVLGLPNMTKPENGAALFFELHRELDDSHRVRLFYAKNSEQTVPEPVEIPNCAGSCTLEAFHELTRPYLPEDWDEECLST